MSLHFPMSDPTPAPAFTFSELFAGVGGFGVGLRQLGGACVFACEREPQARQTFRLNFPPRDVPAFAKDVTEVDAATDVPPHDLLTAGFPCQPFSRLGQQPGFQAPKGHGTLFAHIVRIVRAVRPRMLLLENVPGLATTPGGGEELRVIVGELDGAGYDVQVLWCVCVCVHVCVCVCVCVCVRDGGW